MNQQFGMAAPVGVSAGRPSFIPPIPCRVDMRPFLEEVTAAMQMEIYNQAVAQDASVVRKMLFQKLGMSNFQNDAFVQAVSIAMDVADLFLFGMGVNRFEAIPKAVSNLCTMLSASMLNEMPALQGHLDQAQLQTCQRLLGEFMQLNAQVTQYKQQLQMTGRNNMVMPNGAPMPQQQQMAMPGQQYFNPGVMPQGGGITFNPNGYQQQQQPQRPIVTRGPGSAAVHGGNVMINNPGVHGTHRPNTSVGSFHGAGLIGGVTSDVAPATTPQAAPALSKPAILTARPAPAPIVKAAPAPVQPEPAPAPAPKPMLDQSIRPDQHLYIQMLNIDDDAYQYSFKNMMGPYQFPPVFLFGEQIPFFKQDKVTGDVKTVVLNAGDTQVDYNVHRTDRFFDLRNPALRDATPDRAAAAAALEAVQRQVKLEKYLADIEKEQNIVQANDESLALATHFDFSTYFIDSRGSKDYQSIFREFVESLEQPIPTDVEDDVVSGTFITIDRWSFNKKRAVAARELMQAQTLTDLRNKMVEMSQYVPGHCWEEIHNRLTDHVKEIIYVKLGIDTYDLDGLSFIDDIEGLAQDIAQEHPDQYDLLCTVGLAEILSTTMNTSIVRVAKQELNPRIEDEVVGEIANLLSEDQNYGFCVIEDVTLLPLSSVDLNLAVTNGKKIGYVTTGDTTPYLFEAIHERFKNKHPNARYVKFVLGDGAVFWAFRSLCGSRYMVAPTLNF